MSLSKITYQKILLTVISSGQELAVDAETNKLYKKVTGINVLLTDASNKFSTIELDNNNEEVFPEGWEIIRVLFRDQVPMGYEYHPLNIPAEGSKVKGKYIDVPSGGIYPYKVIISLRLENE